MNEKVDSNSNRKLTQTELVLRYLQEYGSINPLEALQDLGCFRLSARIHQLKKQGIKIYARRITKEGRFGKISFASYSLQNHSKG